MENIFISFFSFLLLITVLSPFYWIKKKNLTKESIEQEHLGELKSLRNIEFENLQDLKIDLELKKITQNEFYELSMPIIKALEKIDKELQQFEFSKEKVIQETTTNQKPKINFCYYCGHKIEQQKSCPSCYITFDNIFEN